MASQIEKYYMDEKFNRVKNAIKSVAGFLPSFIPEVDNTTTFNLGYGRLKLWRIQENNVWVGFILPRKRMPLQNDLIFLSPQELTNFAREE